MIGTKAAPKTTVLETTCTRLNTAPETSALTNARKTGWPDNAKWTAHPKLVTTSKTRVRKAPKTAVSTHDAES